MDPILSIVFNPNSKLEPPIGCDLNFATEGDVELLKKNLRDYGHTITVYRSTLFGVNASAKVNKKDREEAIEHLIKVYDLENAKAGLFTFWLAM